MRRLEARGRKAVLAWDRRLKSNGLIFSFRDTQGFSCECDFGLLAAIVKQPEHVLTTGSQSLEQNAGERDISIKWELADGSNLLGKVTVGSLSGRIRLPGLCDELRRIVVFAVVESCND